jgi:7-cyano-7-deazaguanine reductase
MTDLPGEPSASLLGRATSYPRQYDPDLLHPIARATGRAALPPAALRTLQGTDFWTAFELSWLGPRGMPRVAVAEIAIPCTSPNIVESKSLKLYLNSLNDTRFATSDAVAARMRTDISACCDVPVEVSLHNLGDYARQGICKPVGECLDAIELDEPGFAPDVANLCAAPGTRVAEVLYSDLLKTNCPVTGQPDWATVVVDYCGPRIDRAGLLAYILSFRHHSDFHEHCVERMFCDLWCRVQPERLSLMARYTRRGGIDINPWRSSGGGAPPLGRLVRQ